MYTQIALKNKLGIIAQETLALKKRLETTVIEKYLTNLTVEVLKMKITQEEIAKRRKIYEQARAITKAADGIDYSPYYQEINERYITGEISIEEKKKLLENYYKKILGK